MNILVSFAYLRSDRDGKWPKFFAACRGAVDVMIDSGAFTAYNAGHPISLNQYINYCKRFEEYFWQYVALDVVWNEPATLRNLETMTKAGLRPMPVIVLGGRESLVNDFMEINEHVCVAGGVTEETEYYLARLERVWRLARGSAKLHGLGFTRGLVPLTSKCHSVDSSTWSMGNRFGQLMVFNRLKGCLQVDRRRCRRIPFKLWPRHIKEWVIEAGLSPKAVVSDAFFRTHYSPAQIVSVWSWLRYMDLYTQKGVKFFFAVNSFSTLVLLAATARNATKERVNIEGAFRDAQLMRGKAKSDFLGFCRLVREGAERWLAQ